MDGRMVGGGMWQERVRREWVGTAWESRRHFPWLPWLGVRLQCKRHPGAWQRPVGLLRVWDGVSNACYRTHGYAESEFEGMQVFCREFFSSELDRSRSCGILVLLARGVASSSGARTILGPCLRCEPFSVDFPPAAREHYRNFPKARVILLKFVAECFTTLPRYWPDRPLNFASPTAKTLT